MFRFAFFFSFYQLVVVETLFLLGSIAPSFIIQPATIALTIHGRRVKDVDNGFS
jgi:hypothetical protein